MLFTTLMAHALLVNCKYSETFLGIMTGDLLAWSNEKILTIFLKNLNIFDIKSEKIARAVNYLSVVGGLRIFPSNLPSQSIQQQKT